MIPETTAVDSYELTDGTYAVELRKLVTPNGERLVVTSDDASTPLDALALESLTWQNADFFSDLIGIPHDGGGDATDTGKPMMQIGNEYTTVRIRTHKTATGPRITLRSPKLEYQCWLTPAELDAIAYKPLSFFTDLLETPLGPESDHTHVL